MEPPAAVASRASNSSSRRRPRPPPHLIRATRLRPLGPTERALLRATAAQAAADTSCAACRHSSPPPHAAAVRAGTTPDGRLPQPPCAAAHPLPPLRAPLFLAAEWPRRLLRQKAPFGLRMEGKSEAQMLATLRAYQRNASQPLRCAFSSCAVVGSAGTLRRRQFGEAIDAHEAVLRVNAAPTRGHEAAVGRRTTWRVSNSEKPYFLAALGVPELQVAICHMPWIGSCQRQAFGGAYSETVAYVNPVFYGQLWTMLGRPAHKQSPSTGMLAIALALGVCDRVSIYGFGRSSETNECRHYWECGGRGRYYDPQHTFHDWLAEERLRDRWLAAGFLTNGSSYGEGREGAAAFRQAARGPPVDYAAARSRWAQLLRSGLRA
ncbi:hypothetical protein AB1Y20_010397 [Prymnesium parvum]|uniref:beta-galactoside alpha-(2,6)-sialyltransferase n=1 Tax=Prymnesium parvum TaxID=97485 RepID=A0AB34IRD9_PRYPA